MNWQAGTLTVLHRRTVPSQLASSTKACAHVRLWLQGVADAAWQAKPAVLATKIALMEDLGQAEEAAAALGSALQQWQAGEARVPSRKLGMLDICSADTPTVLSLTLASASLRQLLVNHNVLIVM